MLEIVLTGRNDGYGGEDFTERMFTAAAFNHRILTEAGVPHRFTLVEWNPPEGRPLVADMVRARLPWWDECLVVSPEWHQRTSTNPRLQFMEFFAKNAGIRRSRAEWILTTNSDIFLSREVVEALACQQLRQGTLYRATRIDLDRTIDWQRPTWELFENRASWLREHTLRPPYFTDAAGDFLLLDREDWHRIGGFNEVVRFAKIYKDGQCCIQCAFHGLAIEPLGPIYHLDHDGSYATAVEKWGPKHELAPFGPWWDANHPYVNRNDWGLTAATEAPDLDRGCVWLRTPEEHGPELSVVIDGGAGGATTAMVVKRLLAAHESLEVVVAQSAGAPSVGAGLDSDAERERARTIPVEEGLPWTAALNRALAASRGRLLVWLAQPAYFSVADLAAILESFATDASLDAIACGELWVDTEGRALSAPRPPDATAPVVVVRRGVYDRLGDLDTLSPSPLGDYWSRITADFHVSERLDAIVRIPLSSAPGVNARIESFTAVEWARCSMDSGTSTVSLLPDALLRDYRRRSELLQRAISRRLRAVVPAGARQIALRGVDSTTLLVIAAARSLGLGVVRLFSDHSSRIGGHCAGVPIHRWEAGTGADIPVIGLVAPRRAVPDDRHVFEPPGERAAVVPGAIPSDALDVARSLRAEGRVEEALEVYGLLFDQGRTAPEPVLEMAEMAEHLEQRALALDSYARLLRRRPDEWQLQHEQLLAYRLGSLFKRMDAPARALRYLKRALRASRTEPCITGAAHFHIGELLLARGQVHLAREHYRAAVECLPDHQKAAARLAEADMCVSVPLGDGHADAPDIQRRSNDGSQTSAERAWTAARTLLNQRQQQR